jgi:hypothetical protein
MNANEADRPAGMFVIDLRRIHSGMEGVTTDEAIKSLRSLLLAASAMATCYWALRDAEFEGATKSQSSSEHWTHIAQKEHEAILAVISFELLTSGLTLEVNEVADDA